jgi:uncharacterized membrane protein
MRILLWTLFAATLLVGERVFGKYGSGAKNPVFGLLLMQVAMVGFALANAFYSVYVLKEPFNFSMKWKYILCFFAAGVSVGAFDFIMLWLFGSGTAVSYFDPMVKGLSLVLAVTAGVILFGEKITTINIVGIIVIIIGILLCNWQAISGYFIK